MVTTLMMILLAALAWACMTDLRFRIIPDEACIIIAVAGLAMAAVAGAALAHVASAGVCLAVGAICAHLRFWGWGDAKLFGAAGAVAGFAALPSMLWIMTLSGALLAALLFTAMVATGSRTPQLARMPRWLQRELRRLRVCPTVPYGLAIAIGTAWSAHPMMPRDVLA